MFKFIKRLFRKDDAYNLEKAMKKWKKQEQEELRKRYKSWLKK